MEIIKATKKPIQIETVQWDGKAESATPIINWVLKNDGNARYDCATQYCSGGDEDHVLVIETLEGPMQAREGWWIARGVEGEFYPIKNSVFDKTYDVVERS